MASERMQLARDRAALVRAGDVGAASSPDGKGGGDAEAAIRDAALHPSWTTQQSVSALTQEIVRCQEMTRGIKAAWHRSQAEATKRVALEGGRRLDPGALARNRGLLVLAGGKGRPSPRLL